MPEENSKETTPQNILTPSRARTRLRDPVKVGFHLKLVSNLRRLLLAAGVVAVVSPIGMCNWRGTTGKKAFAAALIGSLVVLACGAIYEVFASWKAKRWQFGLRTWFAIVGLAGIFFAIPANHYVVRRRQAQLMPAINELGGSASITKRNQRGQELYSLWLMLFGETDLVAEFRNVAFTDDDFLRLSKHPSRGALTILAVDGSKITDSGLSYAKEFPRLRSFLFCQCHVTDAGLQQLADAMSLEDICCRNTPTITAEGVRELKKQRPSLLVYRLQSLDPE